MTPQSRSLPPARIQAFLIESEPYLSCEDCFTLLDRYAEEAVDGATVALPGMAARLASCPACADEAESLIELIRNPPAGQ